MTTASRSPPTHRALYPVVQLNLIFPARLSSRSQRAPGGFLSPTPAVGHLLSPPSSSLRYIKATSFFRPPLVRSSSSPLSPSLPRPSEEKTRPDENKEKCQGRHIIPRHLITRTPLIRSYVAISCPPFATAMHNSSFKVPPVLLSPNYYQNPMGICSSIAYMVRTSIFFFKKNQITGPKKAIDQGLLLLSRGLFPKTQCTNK